ncbi:AraC family transcriptional regulator [Lewinella sp. W8]|uniref:helix-turn-helix transcriptional regulator n=1 Tax=Lewinella sp. W8 TaxID=2528208 RepID=UPI001067575E|nr:AraC family transcriptional regulator [Lewinella sp. W8]MTB50587.1 helix-turn-helix domain-containing protein [Lewinella sp. W8]
MMLIPQRLFQSDDVRVLLRDGNNCVLHKSLAEDVIGREAYVANHVVSMVLAGEQTIRTYDDAVITVRTGEMVVLPRGVYYVTDLRAKDGRFRSLLFYFDEEVIHRFLAGVRVAEVSRASAPDHLKIRQSEAIKHFAEATLKVYGEGSLGKELLPLKLQELMHLIAPAGGERAFVEFLFRLTLPKRRNLKTFMEHNYQKPLKVEDYAYLTGRSPSSFRRDFREYFGTTPNKWLRKQRLRTAKMMLDQRDLSVTELSYAVGYDNISYFIREFRKMTGLSPKQYMLHRRGEQFTDFDA